jgi:GMP synthase-like glutamine amidotransferase
MEGQLRNLHYKTGTAGTQMIFIVDMNSKKDSLSYNEFVLPIVSALQPFEPCEVKHFLNVKASELAGYSHIILSGTTLKDFTFLKNLNRFGWIKTCEKPILGICAGMQTITQVYSEPLAACSQVGMTEITTLKENPLFSGTFQAYALHTYTVNVSETFEVLAKSSECVQAIKHKQKRIYGVLFHPEVRNQNILQNFVKIK